VNDLDKLLLGNQNFSENKEKENNENYESKKLENFITYKKIDIIKNRIRNNLKLILLSFSLILIILSLSTYYLLFIYPKQNLNVENELENKMSLANEEEKIANNFNEKGFYGISNDNQNNNLEEDIINETNNTNKIGFEEVRLNIEEKKNLIKECNQNLDCIVSLAVQNKDPSLCLFLKENSNLCIEEYNKRISKESFYLDLANKLLNNEISLEELKNYNVTVEQLIYITGNTELCKFTKENVTACLS